MLIPHHPQSGRSMVEMLGTLAIVGVLSAGAIGGYSYAMNKHRTNELIYEATKRAQWVGTQLEMNNPNPSLNTFGTDSFGGGRFTGDVVQLENGQIGIKVAGLKEAVCQNILNSIGDNTVIREMRDVNCNDDNGTATLVFNRDLSTSDSEITPNEPEVSGEVSEQASVATEATATQNPDDVHCNGNGSWNGSSCYCDNGWQGDNCSEEEPESSEPATINNEPVITTTAQSGEDHACSGNGYWNYYVGQCSCNPGWGGNDCSQDMTDACGEHGSWIESTGGTGYCDCESGWGGDNCSEVVCSGHGWWISWYNNGAGGCFCDSGWGGSDCSKCSGHGTWYDYLNNGAGGCECNTGWGGSDCSIGKSCSKHGSWNSSLNNGAGGCECNINWGGTDCSEDHRNDCSGHGYWYQSNNNGAGGCDCNSGWVGSDCSQTARAACSNHGTFIVDTSKPNGGYCSCDSGWGGSDCSDGSARERCSNHGYWNGTTCTCDPGAGGDDCSEELKCTWTEWFDVDSPNSGGGDFETYENIRAAGGAVCAQPQEIKCEATNYPGLPLEQVGQQVHCDLSTGLICRNEEQPGLLKMCINYRISVLCCE